MLPLDNLSLADSPNQGLSKVPEWIGVLTKLEVLCLGHSISQLPDSIVKLQNLKVLDLSENKFETIPQCLLSLPSNCVIKLMKNPLRDNEKKSVIVKMTEPDYKGPQFIFA